MKKRHINQALSLAKHGGYLFPAVWKKGHKPLVKWSTESSKDPNVILGWADLHPGAYFCMDLAKSGRTVVDVDSKKGKDGMATLKELAQFNDPLPLTLLVKTPNNGYHLHFTGKAAFGANKLGEGVDIPVMVPIPGAEVKGKGTYQLLKDHAAAPLPEWISTMAGETVERSMDQPVPLTALDKPNNIKLVIQYLSEEVPAIEGEGGDDRTYKVAQRVRDYGISEGMAFELIAQHYNDRCQPVWTAADLKKKIHNAYSYAKSQSGALDPTVDFEPVQTHFDVDEPPRPMFISIGDLLKDADLAPKWVLKGYLEKDCVSVIYGDTGTYKSFAAIDMALHIALGLDWHGHKVKQPGPSYYLAAEGRGGIKRRLKAWCLHHEIDETTIPFYALDYNVSLDSNETTSRMCEEIRTQSPNTALVVIDTLAKSFGSLDENSNKDMNTAIRRAEYIREYLGCHVIIIHHTGHSDKDRPRGAYTLMAGVDALFRMYLSPDEVACLEKAKKMKDGVGAPDKWFSTTPIILGYDEDGDPYDSLVLDVMPGYTPPVAVKGMGPAQQFLTDQVTTAGIIEADELSRRFRLYCEENDKKFNRANFNRTMKRIMARGAVELEDNIYKAVGGLASLEGLIS